MYAHTVKVGQGWVLLGLVCVTVAISDLGDAIGKAGRSVSTACTANQRPHAGP